MSVTALYGARSGAVPFGAWIVTHRCSSSAGSSHQLASPREVAIQYANCSWAGVTLAHHGSSKPFHIASALAEGSASRSPITLRSHASLSVPGLASLRVARFIHVYRPRAAALPFHSIASGISSSHLGLVAGPTCRRLTPAAAPSPSASNPS